MLQAYDCIMTEMEEVRELFDRELLCDIPLISDLLDHINKFRGKMLRPMLVLLSGQVCGGLQPPHRVIAAVLEMVHMATLVHDDVLDETEIRRRGKTIHSLHGNETAVMLGDLLISRAFHLCSSLDHPGFSRRIAAAANTVCEGELMQLLYRDYYDLEEQRYLDIISRKTAALISCSCYLGAQAADAEEPVCQNLAAYGTHLGIAFQIMDDVVDLTGKETQAGKTLGTDFQKGKITLPGIHLLRICSPEQKRTILTWLDRRTPQDYQEYGKILHESGSIDYARQRAKHYIEQAQQELASLPAGEAHKLLMELAELVV
ncbi:MAG: Octaprenyl-diphosphate synthase [Planctomycetes bacterium ADurb.Bin412]|nr:MAG: Octaprenyl-diphosphate synthase [Planctomycetes bacterium ADurb.Bin412]